MPKRKSVAFLQYFSLDYTPSGFKEWCQSLEICEGSPPLFTFEIKGFSNILANKTIKRKHVVCFETCTEAFMAAVKRG